MPLQKQIIPFLIKLLILTTLFQLQTPFNYLLFELSVIELFVCLTCNTVLAANSLYGEMLLSDTMCQLHAFEVTFLGENNI